MPPNDGRMGAKTCKMPYFAGFLAAFAAARSTLAERFLEHTVIGLFLGFNEGTRRPHTRVSGILSLLHHQLRIVQHKTFDLCYKSLIDLEIIETPYGAFFFCPKIPQYFF